MKQATYNVTIVVLLLMFIGLGWQHYKVKQIAADAVEKLEQVTGMFPMPTLEYTRLEHVTHYEDSTIFAERTYYGQINHVDTTVREVVRRKWQFEGAITFHYIIDSTKQDTLIHGANLTGEKYQLQ